MRILNILRMIDFSKKKKIDMIDPVIISYFGNIFSDLLVIARLVVVKHGFTCSKNENTYRSLLRMTISIFLF